MARKREIKEGSHIYHRGTGDYLGVSRGPASDDGMRS